MLYYSIFIFWYCHHKDFFGSLYQIMILNFPFLSFLAIQTLMELMSEVERSISSLKEEQWQR